MRHTVRRGVGLLLGLTVACGAALPTTGDLSGWRSTQAGRGWRTEGGALIFDHRLAGTLVAAEPVWEKRGAITFRFRQLYGPGARLELRFRAQGDERGYAALLLDPERCQVSLIRKENGLVLDTPTATADVATLAEGAHRLEYRLEGRRVSASLDGKEILAVDSVAPRGPGRVGLAAALACVELRELLLESAPPEELDSFDSLSGWHTLYGPDAWHTARAEPGSTEAAHVAVFSAPADGAIVGDQEWTHFAVEIRGRFLEAANTWACFGLRPKLAPDGGSHYVVEVRGQQHVLAFAKLVAGQRDAALGRDVPLPPVEIGRWYTLRCEFVGDRIAVDIDGKRCLDLVDPHPLERGRTAISASYATVQLDDFRQREVPSDYVFAANPPPAAPYDPGPALPPAAAAGPADEAYWYLLGRDLRVAVHRQTGALGGFWRRSDGCRIASRTLPLYKLETRSSAVHADAAGDAVEAVLRQRPAEIVLRCANPALPGIRIEKGYAVAPGGDRLIETLRFVNDTDRPDVFLTLAERMVLDAAYREDALYTGGSYFGPLLPARAIRERVLTDAFKRPWVTGITNGRPSWVLALNHTLDCHLATYRYRVNGQYVLPWNSIWTEELNTLYHTPVGWEMGVATLHLRPRQVASTEVQYRLFQGSRLDFYEAYTDLPEVARWLGRSSPRPAWLRDLKMPVESTSDYALGLTEDGILLKLDSPFAIWGDLPVSGNLRTGAGTARWPVERVRAAIQRDQARSPRLKVGFYTWAWSAHHRSDIVSAHPEWFIPRDQAGQTRNAYPLALSYLRCLSAPGCLDATLRQYRDLLTYYGEDFQYLDNDGTGVQIIDWENLRLDQDYDWQRLHEGIQAATRRHPFLSRTRRPGTSGAVATFFNNRVLPQGDIAFAEFMEAEIQNPDWRRPANEMVPLKILQKRDPERVIPLLYWRPQNEPAYSIYCVGLGLLPWGDRLSQVPIINAAFETRGLEIMDAGLQPDWQRDLETTVEAYALRLGRAAVISFIGHAATPQETDLAFDTARLGLEPGRPYTAWRFDLVDPRDQAGRLTERQQRQAYQANHWADETLVAARFLEAGDRLPARYRGRSCSARPQGLSLLMLSHSPALAWSVNGQRCHFWLPSGRYLDLNGTWDLAADRCEAICRSAADLAEIVIPIPPDRHVLEVCLDGERVAWEPEPAHGAWLARVGLPRGTHRVGVRFSGPGPRPSSRLVSFETPALVRAGETLPVRVAFAAENWEPASRVVLSVLHEGVLVASARPRHWSPTSAEFELAIPAAARPGLYDLAFSPVGVLSADEDSAACVRIEAGAWQPSTPPGGENGQPAVRIWEVGRTLQGIEVLRAATDTFDHRGGTQLADLDLERLAARCGLLDDAPSPWGYGFCGLEIRGAKALTLDLRNSFFEANRDGFEMGDRYLDSFAGIIIDYHTPRGYSKRVALGLGVLNPARPVPAPSWGKAAAPDLCLAWSRTLLEKPTDTLTVDLAAQAPPDWDGQVWFSLGVDTVTRGLQIEATIRGAAPP